MILLTTKGNSFRNASEIDLNNCLKKGISPKTSEDLQGRSILSIQGESGVYKEGGTRERGKREK